MTEKQTWRWVSNILDRRTNSGFRESWYFYDEYECKRAAVLDHHTVATEPDRAQIEALWRSLERAGWYLTNEPRLMRD